VSITLRPEPLVPDSFAPYGDVIEAAAGREAAMNAGRFERFDDICAVDPGEDGRVAVSIARCRRATELPYRLDLVERHPLGSQAFIPLTPCRLLVVVAPPGDTVASADLRAFASDGHQGVNYRPGTWHMPLIAFEAGQEFLVIDRAAGEANCDVHRLEERVVLVAE
jgi:ureidoglycolate lyase